jgi:hypothetical protein
MPGCRNSEYFHQRDEKHCDPADSYARGAQTLAAKDYIAMFVRIKIKPEPAISDRDERACG